MKNKFKIPIGDNFIVTEAYQADPEFPIEITTYIEDKNGVILQDICLVREHYDYNTGKIVLNKNLVDCLVWGNPNNEDFTDDFTMEIRKDEE